MAIPYKVCKKVYFTDGKKEELWFAVAKAIQSRGGMPSEIIINRISNGSGLGKGAVEAVLSVLGEAIEFALKLGYTVNIKGLGSFQVAVTSKGFENPVDITPGEVNLSRVYFVADRKLSQHVRDAGAYKIAFKDYLPREFWEKEKDDDNDE